MKIYKNPWTSIPCYFVPTGRAYSGKGEASKKKGIEVALWKGDWKFKESQMYDSHINEMPVVGEIKREELKNALIAAVLGRINEE